jgi:hypothetical protein
MFPTRRAPGQPIPGSIAAKTPEKEHKELFHRSVDFDAYAARLQRVRLFNKHRGAFNICLAPETCVLVKKKPPESWQKHRRRAARFRFSPRATSGEKSRILASPAYLGVARQSVTLDSGTFVTAFHSSARPQPPHTHEL